MTIIPFEKKILPNGLEVIVHVDKSMPVAAVNVWYHVGSKNEVPGRTGFAHLFEHVMFEGSKNHNKDYFEPLQKIGANINGSTTNDRTNYWEDVPSNYLELALWLESDRMGFLLDALDQERFDLQRDVVKNERRQSYENRPYGTAHLKIQAALFPHPHPYNWPTIGSQEDLNSATLEDVKDFFRNYYHPSNASICVAGDVDQNEVFENVNKYFGGLKPGPKIDRFKKIDSSIIGQTSIELEDNVQLPRLYLAWPTVPDFTRVQAALDVLSIILTDGRSSRLNKNLVYESQKAHDVRAFHHGQEISGEFHLTATVTPEGDINELEKEIRSELEQLSVTAPSESEIARAKNRIESYYVMQMEKIGGFGGRADQLNYYNVMAGDPSIITTDMDRYKSITPQDVYEAAQLLGENHVKLTVTPTEEKKYFTTGVDRTQMPTNKGNINFTPPSPERYETSNGLEILLINKPNIPVTSLAYVIPTGVNKDPLDKPGLSKFSMDMLQEGTISRTSSEISEEIEFLGSHLSRESGREYSLLSASGLSQHFEKTVDIIADISQNPIFPEKEYQRVLSEKIADLGTLGDNADLVANIASRAILYGADSEYGHPANGTLESIKSIKKTDLETNFNNHILSSGSTMLVVGSTTMKDAVKIIEPRFGKVIIKSSNMLNATEFQSPETHNKPSIYLIDRPGAAQSVIRAGHLTIPRTHEDYYAVAFLNYVLGGEYSSRLNMNLRQEKGYSYGFYSSIIWTKSRSAWLARGSVQTEVTAESVQEIINEFQGIKYKNPISEKEFAVAKDGLVKGIPSQYETHSQIMSQMVRLINFRLPLDHFTQSIEKLHSLELNEVLSAATKHVMDTQLQIIIVGDKSKILDGLSGINASLIETDMYGLIRDKIS